MSGKYNGMLHLLATIVLGPLLMVQGLWVRKRIPKLPEPEGSRSGMVGRGTKVRILVLGDSAAAGVGVAHQDQALAGPLAAALSVNYSVEWRLEAVSGTTTSAALERLVGIGCGEYDVAVTSLGVNDVVAGVGRDRWREQQRLLRALLRERFGVSRIVVSGFPPVAAFPALPQPLRWYLGRRSRELDADLERDVRGEADVTYLSLDFVSDMSLMAVDGFHPGPEIYRSWADAAARVIDQTLKGA